MKETWHNKNDDGPVAQWSWQQSQINVHFSASVFDSKEAYDGLSNQQLQRIFKSLQQECADTVQL